MTDSPRVTLGIATYNRDTYLAAAIDSCLNQDYESLEVLVVVDGSTNPRIDEVLAGYAGEPRLRVVSHERNRGIAAAYNTFVSAGRGELIAMLGDDDVALPGRIRRQVEVFDRFPDTGVVHGDGTIIDARGRQVGLWPSRDFSPAAAAPRVLLQSQPPGRSDANGPPAGLRGGWRLRRPLSRWPTTSTSGCAPPRGSASATAPAAR